ncbi:MAG: hypothetical protein Fur0012_08620 [Elusimicrobiota bacterium]
MENNSFSVIIPACDRPVELEACLKALSIQDYPREKIQIIVVDDGPLKQSATVCERAPVKIEYISQKPAGPAAARNLGLTKACNEIILFLGDDVIACENLLSEHNRLHSINHKKNAGFLGYTTWSKDIPVTHFMRWLEESGVQFDYGSLKAGEKTDFWHFYTCNVSIKADFLREKNIFFNEKFQFAAYEDTEFGWRLEKEGFELYYGASACSFHMHRITTVGYALRMYRAGKSAPLLESVIGKPRKKTFGFFMLIYKAVKACFYFSFAWLIEKRFYSHKIFAGLTENFYAIGYFFADRLGDK